MNDSASGEFQQVPRRLCYRIILSFAMLAALTCSLEAVLRLGLGLGNPVLIVPDQSCEYILKPDQNIYRFFARTQINHLGMRSDEVSLRRTPGVLRILFVGDSITYGTSRIDQRQIFTEILHHDLPSLLRRPVEVLNASASAWAIDNELSFIRSRGIFQSDIVLLVLNDGDVTQPRSTIDQVGDDLPRVRPATAIGELYSHYFRPRLLRMIRRSDAGDTVSDGDSDVIRHNLEDLDNFQKQVITSGARLAIVYVPFPPDLPNRSSRAQSILHSWSSVHNVGLFDLTSEELQHTPAEITLNHGVHFNDIGHLLVAKSIEKLWSDVINK
jgi:hypothetical protein